MAVLRFDRRPREQGDVPFAVQADDAVAAVAELRRRVGDVPVGLWGWSQGAWAASAVAARRPELIAFLVLVATSGVSPAAQMRYGTAQQLLLHGYGESDEWTPAEESVAVWRRAAGTDDLTVRRLAG
ncbi:alpha/beta fold hydrolase [Micromonospora phaseoli]|uniref:alpha/beta fold hydrolase n=1 Tax=Micromonospora phaseoli TaxID=1144548 RepID=UPI000A46A266|nr:alpha/beta fold hydrolase [Micromonospora phaseoli]